jgi:hypothetical protein
MHPLPQSTTAARRVRPVLDTGLTPTASGLVRSGHPVDTITPTGLLNIRLLSATRSAVLCLAKTPSAFLDISGHDALSSVLRVGGAVSHCRLFANAWSIPRPAYRRARNFGTWSTIYFIDYPIVGLLRHYEFSLEIFVIYTQN